MPSDVRTARNNEGKSTPVRAKSARWAQYSQAKASAPASLGSGSDFVGEPSAAAGPVEEASDSPEPEKRRRFSKRPQSASDQTRKSSFRMEEKRRSCSMVAIKAELANAVEEHDLVELRRIVPIAARRCAEPGGSILISEVESAQRIIDHELQQKLLQHHEEQQHMLLKSHEELVQMLTEVDEASSGKKQNITAGGAVGDGAGGAGGTGQPGGTGQLDREAALQLQVATARALEANLAEMRRGAAESARALEAQLEQMRQGTAEKLKVLEARLGSAQKAPAVTVQMSPRSPRAELPGQTAQVRLGNLTSAVDPVLEAETLAFEQTLNPHYVLMSAEDDVARAALANAQQEAKRADVPGNGQQNQMKSILGFIPNTLRRCIRHNLVNFQQWKVLLEPPLKSTYNPVLARFPAVVVFADASGFTRLTESLARQPQGAEKIGDTLNAFFRPLIGLVHEHGGDVIKFSGDALTIIWAAADPAPPPGQAQDMGSPAAFPDLPKLAAAAAARFCLEVQEEIPKFGNTNVPGCSLTMHIGVGFGMTTLLQLGGLMGRWEYCIAGSALEQISIAEPLASSGETVFSPQARELAEGRFLFEDLKDRGEKAASYSKLTGMVGGNSAGRGGKDTESSKALTVPTTTYRISRRMPKLFCKKQRECSGDTAAGSPTSPPWWWLSGNEGMDARLIRRFFPSAVGQHPMLDSEDFRLEEMRRLSILFCSIQGLDPADEGSKTEDSQSCSGCTVTNFRRNSGAVHTQLILRLIQGSVYALEGSVNKFLVDDKGVLLLVVFGLPPLIHFTDDPTRAVLCAMRVCDLFRDEGLKGYVGVSTGACWCGVVGTKERQEYTVLGDVVNLSARLMGQASENGVIVDGVTRDIAMRTLDFVDRGELRLKGKEKPVRAFRFEGIAKGKDRHHGDRFQASLLTWTGWPARALVHRALELRRRKSGVVFVSGPGGSGKGEIVELMRAWASQEGFTLLAGQNMDPSGTFACPLLCLQEAYRELVRRASKDPFWREKGREQIVACLGGDNFQSNLEGAPGHTEIYWMLIAMLRLSNGEEAMRMLEPWAPLLNMIVTQLAFAPRMIQAMVERNEQHARADRLSQLCEAVLGGFSAHGSLEGGTMVLLHIRRSSALLQKRERQETAVINALASLCMCRQKEAAGKEEQRPLVLCVVARREGLRDQFLEDCAVECDGDVDLADLNEDQTADYLQHLMMRPSVRQRRSRMSTRQVAINTPDEHPRVSSVPAPVRKKKTTSLVVPKPKMKGWRSEEVLGRKSEAGLAVAAAVKFTEDTSDKGRDASPRGSTISRNSLGPPVTAMRAGRMAGCSVYANEKSSDAPRSSSCSSILKKRDSTLCQGEGAASAQAVLAQYVFECTGGNCGEIEILVRDFERQELLRRNEAGVLTCIVACGDIKWLRENCTLPEVLVGMAFGVFEQLEPQHKMFLKAASAVPGEFGLQELKAALPEMTDDAILETFESLSSANVRALRKVSKSGLPRRENRYRFYSLVLSQASSTLVLERQRTIIRQRTTKFQTESSALSSQPRRLSTLLSGGAFMTDCESGASDEESS